MQGRADGCRCDRMARKRFHRRQSRRVSAVRDKKRRVGEAGHLVIGSGNDPHSALAGEVIQRGRYAADAEIDRTTGNGYRDSLAAFEMEEAHLEPFGGEVAFL